MLDRQKVRRIANLLDRAADHMDEVGLVKGTFYKSFDIMDYSGEDKTVLRLGHGKYKNAPCCAYGALYAKAGSTDDVYLASRLVCADLGEQWEYDGLDGWNDAKGRQKRHVVSAFRRTAARLRGAR